MTLPASTTPQAKPGAISIAIALIIIVLLIGAVIGISFLPNPYYAIGQVVLYAVMVASIAVQLRACLRIAQGSQYSSKLHAIVFWIVLGVFSVVAHLGDIFRSDNRDYVTLATNVAVYLALFYTLELVEKLLRATAAANPPAAAPDALDAGAPTSTPQPTAPA